MCAAARNVLVIKRQKYAIWSRRSIRSKRKKRPCKSRSLPDGVYGCIVNCGHDDRRGFPCRFVEPSLSINARRPNFIRSPSQNDPPFNRIVAPTLSPVIVLYSYYRLSPIIKYRLDAVSVRSPFDGDSRARIRQLGVSCPAIGSRLVRKSPYRGTPERS